MTVNKKLAIFDLDHTILKCNSDHSWLDYLINKGFIKREEYFEQNAEFQNKFKEGNVNYKDYYEFTIQYLKDNSDDYISDIRSDFMKEIIEPSINIYALRLIHKHYEKDEELLLASGTTSIILFFFVCIEIASEPILFKEFTISLLKSIKTVSTISIIFLSVTLRPLINFD